MKSLQQKILVVSVGATLMAGLAVAAGVMTKAVPGPVLGLIVAASGVAIGMGVWEMVKPRIATLRESLEKTKQYDYERHASAATGDEFDFLDAWALAVTERMREVRRTAQESKTEITDLVSIGQILNESRNRAQVVTRVIDESLRRLAATNAAILLLNESRGELMVEATRGEAPLFRSGECVPSNNPIFAQVERAKGPIIIGGGVRARVGATVDAGTDGNVACVPLVIERDVIGMLAVGSKADGGSFVGRDLEVLSYLGNAAALVLENTTLQRQLTEHFLDVVGALASSVDARDPNTRAHSRRVTEYAVALGRARQLSPDDMDTLQFGAILHDIGKIGIPDRILLKTGRLTPEEFEFIKSHPVQGENILRNIKQLPWPILPIVRSHHERWGGGGYPDDLRGEAIPPLARLVTVADVFDAITSRRSYRDAMDLDVALGEIRRGTNNLFDPRLVAPAIEVLRAEYSRVGAQFPS